ncbi:MAG: 30S ribosomal protein S12 methylthiotransferase RimO [Candidatus Eisenbacteria bacterium]
MKIAFITLGCPKNLVDTEVMLGLLADEGHEFTPEAGEADTIIVSTCSFISAAVQESRGVVDQCLALKADGAVRHVVVAGCLPQRYGAATWGMFPGVDAVVGCSDFEKIVEVVRQVESDASVFSVGVPEALYDDSSPRVLGTPGHIAYVKIADGCDNRCAYCVIPSIRGALRSRTPESVIREVANLAESGVREVNLIAQDTTAYGTDIAPDVTLPALLSALADTGVPWIRVLYTHPAHVTDELLSVMSGLEPVVPYLDMPIQHISDRVLAAMGRGTDGEHIRSLISRVREAVPGVSIRSSVMVGFPDETDAEFQELLAFVRQGNVDHLGVFEYSPEPGTPAFSLPGRIEAETASVRARAIIETMEGLTEARGQNMIGREVTILIDSSGSAEEGRPAVGRTSGQAWEMDGEVLVEPDDQSPAEGDFARVKVTGVAGFDLTARIA